MTFLQGKMIMHDPFAMRPFFGYNFGHYLQHWLSFKDRPNIQLPKIFHVNWFRKNDQVILIINQNNTFSFLQPGLHG